MRSLVLACVACLLAASTAHASPPITAFQEESSPVGLIARSAGAIASVGVDGVNLTGPGAVSAPDPSAPRRLTAAHRAGLRATLLVGNWSSRVNNFYEPLAHATLGQPSLTQAVAGALAGDVRARGWDGITVDLESLTPRDAAGLSALLVDLRAALPADATVAATVSNSTQGPQFAAQGDDLPAPAPATDQVILMAYDEHGPWEDAPGPVGALGWQRAGLRVLLRSVPATKLVLGVAGCGYGRFPRRRVMLSDAGARALVARTGARARWVPAAGEWTATLPDGGTLWWSDARSLELRIALARSLGLGGLAVWSLGLSDPITNH